MSDLKDTRDNINEMIENIERDNPIFAANIGAFMNTLYDEIERLEGEVSTGKHMYAERGKWCEYYRDRLEQLEGEEP